jgi:RNA polymerase sigma factor (sigma-70 family)
MNLIDDEDSIIKQSQTDGALLRQFVQQGDRSALKLLLEKHSSLVMSVCQQVLGNRHDAEEAFQETFLKLIKKAESIQNYSALSSWLYRVAHREAITIGRQVQQKRKLSKHLSEEPAVSSDHLQSHEFDELNILHEELNELDEKYRGPIVLCYLEGKSQKEAAQELNVTLASLKASVSSGRERLQKRLLRRGLTITTVLAAWQTFQASNTTWATTTLLQKTVSACIAKTALTTASVSATVSSATTISTKQLLIKGAIWMAISSGQKTIVGVIAILLLVGGGTTVVLMNKKPELPTNKNKTETVKKSSDMIITEPTSFGANLAFPQDVLLIMQELKRDWTQDLFNSPRDRRNAISQEELKIIDEKYLNREQEFIKNFLEIANQQKGTWIEITCLKLIACRALNTDQGKEAVEKLRKILINTDLKIVSKGLYETTNTSEISIQSLAPFLIDRVKKEPEHPQAARLLASIICRIAATDREATEPPESFKDAADLIIKHHVDSPDICNFCEHLGRGNGSPAWAGEFEQHLRIILEKNRHRAVQATALYALASVIKSTDKSRQAEAKKLYEEFIEKFDGSESYHFAGIEKSLNQDARRELAKMRSNWR